MSVDIYLVEDESVGGNFDLDELSIEQLSQFFDVRRVLSFMFLAILLMRQLVLYLLRSRIKPEFTWLIVTWPDLFLCSLA